MKDRNGEELKVGDRVYLECVVTQMQEGQRDGCNIELRTVEAIPPGDNKTTIHAVNGRMVRKVKAETPIPATVPMP